MAGRLDTVGVVMAGRVDTAAPGQRYLQDQPSDPGPVDTAGGRYGRSARYRCPGAAVFGRPAFATGGRPHGTLWPRRLSLDTAAPGQRYLATSVEAIMSLAGARGILICCQDSDSITLQEILPKITYFAG